MDRLDKIIKCDNKIYDFISKLDISDVWEDGIDRQNMSEIDKKEIEICFNNMNGNFSFKHIKPIYLRKYIKKVYNNVDINK